jgi:CrcB protein
MRRHASHQPFVDPRELAAIFAGGMLGSLARVGLAQAFPRGAGAWPWATLGVNLVGALVLGWAVVRVPPTSYRRPFIGVGVCGALTTFSTWMLDSERLADGGRGRALTANLAGSLLLGLAAVALGRALGRVVS